MKTFVINLPRSSDRREYIVRECAKSGLDMEIVEAVDGRELTAEQLSREVAGVGREFLTPGEIGCAMSHIKAYRRIVAERLPAALIVEDDAILRDGLRELLNAFDAHDNTSASVYLLTPGNKVFLKNRFEDIGGRRFYHSLDAIGSYGYVVTGEAAKALADFLTPIRFMADLWKFFTMAGVVRVMGCDRTVIGLNEDITSILTGGRDGQAENRRRMHFSRRLRATIPFPARARYSLWKVFVRPFLAVSRGDGF